MQKFWLTFVNAKNKKFAKLSEYYIEDSVVDEEGNHIVFDECI